MKLKRLCIDEKFDKKKKSLTLKVKNAKDMESDEDFQSENDKDTNFMFRKYKEFLRHEKQTSKSKN